MKSLLLESALKINIVIRHLNSAVCQLTVVSFVTYMSGIHVDWVMPFQCFIEKFDLFKKHKVMMQMYMLYIH